MRSGQEPKLLLDEHERTVALNLSADYCAEHEWGIKSIRSAFGMTNDGFGLDRRRIRTVPSALRWIEGHRDAGSYWSGKRPKNTRYQGFWMSERESPKDAEPSGEVPRFYGDTTLSTGWSDGDFGAFSIKDDEIKRLREIFSAMQSKDAAIWLGGGGAFENAGLTIGIASRLSKEVVDSWDAHDREQFQLQKEFAASGIEDRLRKAGKDWFSLRPQRGERGELRVLLNPVDQRNNKWGIYTIADLDAWIRDEGPVPNRGGRR